LNAITYNEAVKPWKIIILILVVALLSWGLVSLEGSKNDMDRQRNELEQKLGGLETENTKLKNDIDYYQNPANLLKELKSQTNYREPGESLIIVVPGASSSIPSSSASSSQGN